MNAGPASGAGNAPTAGGVASGMDLPAFSVTWDYRCPFARNAHEHLVAALEGGAAWDVTFLPFTLSQVHVPEGGTPAWDDPSKRSELAALEAGLVVRDRFPERFLAVHRGLFAARHDQSRDLRDPVVLEAVLDEHGVPGSEVLAEVAAGWPSDELAKAHLTAVDHFEVFGVPTFIVGDHAVFVRLMTRPDGDAAASTELIERIVRRVADEPEINEFKHTSLSR